MKTFDAILLKTLGLMLFERELSCQAAFFTLLGDIPGGGFLNGANGVPDDGKVVLGASEIASGLKAFRWDAVNGMVSLPGFLSFAADVSKDGKLIGGNVTSVNGIEAALWTIGVLSRVER